MTFKLNIIILFILTFTSCSKNTNQKIIIIQPLGNFNIENAKSVLNEIKGVNSNVILRSNLPLPENAYYQPRNRYRADLLIKNLKKNVGQDSIIVGLTNVDISTTKGKIKDWGVMGLGYRPGKSCIVSSFRLSKKNTQQQFYKVVLHELGHTEGLPHCKIKTCLMRDAEGGNHLDEEKNFCSDCTDFLREKGWKIK